MFREACAAAAAASPTPDLHLAGHCLWEMSVLLSLCLGNDCLLTVFGRLLPLGNAVVGALVHFHASQEAKRRAKTFGASSAVAPEQTSDIARVSPRFSRFSDHYNYLIMQLELVNIPPRKVELPLGR